MNPPLHSSLLIAQHRKIDEGLVGVVKGNGQLAALAESLALLRLHIYVEEVILFPPLEASGLTMPVFVMKREHGQMWSLLDLLIEACESAVALDSLQGTARTLFQLLQMHNTKEEQVVYTALDRLAADDDGGSIVRAMTAVRIPEGWVCAFAAH